MIIALIFLLAAFVQSSVGFGFALVSMPLLARVLALQTATPLVALLALAVEGVILLRYHHAFQWSDIRSLSLVSLTGIPLGVFLLRYLPGDVVATALGAILCAYAVYALLQPALPNLAHSAWAYGFGFLAGLLGGAYSISGPPVIVYGSCRRWEPAQFKSNLQGFFLVNGSFVFLAHALSGNVTAQVWQAATPALPGMALGLLLGFMISRRLAARHFRRAVLLLLLALGISLF